MIEQPQQVGDLGKIGRRLKKLGRNVGRVVKKAAPIIGAGALLYAGGAGAASLLARRRAQAAPAAAPGPVVIEAPSPAPIAPTVIETVAQGAAAALPAVAQIVAARDAAKAVSAGVPPQLLPALDVREQLAPRNFAPIVRAPGGELTAAFDPVEVRAPRAGKRQQVPWAWIAAGGGALVLVLLLTQRRG